MCSHQQCSGTPASHGVIILPQPHTSVLSPAASAPSTPQHSQRISLSRASGPCYQVRLGFRALLTLSCYNVSVLSAFGFTILIPCPLVLQAPLLSCFYCSKPKSWVLVAIKIQSHTWMTLALNFWKAKGKIAPKIV